LKKVPVVNFSTLTKSEDVPIFFFLKRNINTYRNIFVINCIRLVFKKKIFVLEICRIVFSEKNSFFLNSLTVKNIKQLISNIFYVHFNGQDFSNSVVDPKWYFSDSAPDPDPISQIILAPDPAPDSISKKFGSGFGSYFSLKYLTPPMLQKDHLSSVSDQFYVGSVPIRLIRLFRIQVRSWIRLRKDFGCWSGSSSAKGFGSDQIRIHNTAFKLKNLEVSIISVKE